ncbi:MAG: hypothetical protein ACRDQA_31125 [Nocardioidaceae bacterium]
MSLVSGTSSKPVNSARGWPTRLSSLFNVDNEAVFDKVIVITRPSGARRAAPGDGPYVLQHIAGHATALAEKKYAVVVDEAHSSQSGESAADLKLVLRGLAGEQAADFDGIGETKDDWLSASVKARGRHSTISVFAFTATPEPKTLELFGSPDPATGGPCPFHVHSMRQAIEEGFSLDPLRNYITYKTCYRLANAGPDDPEVDPA